MKKGTKRLSSNLSQLPAEIQKANRFLLWRAEFSAKRNKILKSPYYIDGFPRHGDLDSPEDLSRLASLRDALDALDGSDYTGVGFALVEGEGIAAFDIDKCLTPDGEMIPSHAGASLVHDAERAGAYIEVSPSGRGLRILGPSDITAAYSKDGLEYWGRGRYVTLTGSIWANPRGWHSIEAYRESLGVREKSSRDTYDQEVLVTPRMVKELRSALECISSEERDTWVRMGHALRQLGTKGLDLWLEWSKTSDKFDKDDALRVWDSMNPGRTNFKAVFAEAQREGWENPRSKGAEAEDDYYPDDIEDGELVLIDDQIDLGLPKLHPTEFVLDGFLPTGVSLIAGAWGAGKSTNLIPVFASVAHVAPERWGLWPQIRRKVIWITEAPDQARDTLYSMVVGEEDGRQGAEEAETPPKTDRDGPDSEDLGGSTTYEGVKDAYDEQGAAEKWQDVKDWFLVYPARRTPARQLAISLKKLIADHSYMLDPGGSRPMFQVQPVIVLDTVSANLDIENESDNSEVGAAMSALKQMLPGVPLVLVGHTPKAVAKSDLMDMSFRGAGAWEADAVATYYLVHDEEIGFRFLALRKCRFTPDYPEISFGRGSGRELVPTPWGDPQSKGFVHGVPRSSRGDDRREALKKVREEKDEARKNMTLTTRQTNIMELVTRRTARQELTWKALLSSELGGKKEILFEAMSRLLRGGVLKIVEVPEDLLPKGRGRPPTDFVLAEEVDETLFFNGIRKTIALGEIEE